MTLNIPNEIINDTPADAVPVDANYKSIAQHVNVNVIDRSGSVKMTGQLTLVGDPVQEDHAARKGYVDAILPAGVIMPYGGAAAPSGWLLCQGASLSTTEFPKLFSVLGYSYGGTGGTFQLPNLQGRVPIGLYPADPRFDTVGERGGSWVVPVPYHQHTIDHTHAANQTGNISNDHQHAGPSHTHAGSYVLTDAYYGSGLTLLGVAGAPGVSGDTGAAVYAGGTEATGGVNANHSHLNSTPTFYGPSGAAGTSGVELVPQYITINYIIKLA